MPDEGEHNLVMQDDGTGRGLGVGHLREQHELAGAPRLQSPQLILAGRVAFRLHLVVAGVQPDALGAAADTSCERLYLCDAHPGACHDVVHTEERLVRLRNVAKGDPVSGEAAGGVVKHVRQLPPHVRGWREVLAADNDDRHFVPHGCGDLSSAPGTRERVHAEHDDKVLHGGAHRVEEGVEIKQVVSIDEHICRPLGSRPQGQLQSTGARPGVLLRVAHKKSKQVRRKP
mmetsp:Transcript_54215/g.154445  ORF Transcript_54215/g.154445 Transcript_54215/m.154445 type:complete len:230 (-) Transcript_54215:1300-1989(-)